MKRAEIPKPVRVLLVEDSAAVREAVASEFRADHDFAIVGEAASLSEARGVLATADVVIVDLGLPDGSGADLIRELRDANPEARAIVLTSAFDPTLHARAIERGAAAVLDKITQLGQVAPAVRRILDMPDPVARKRAAAWLRVAFDGNLPHARWGPLFEVFRREHPGARLDWRAVGFPCQGRSLLDGADVGVFVHPPPEVGLRDLPLDASPMVVVMAVGHRLAHHDTLSVADVLDEPFPGGTNLRPEWCAFWTLDDQRGRPPERTDDDVTSAEHGLQVVVAGRAIATVPQWVASGLAHPGVIALPLKDGPPVTTSLLWRDDEDNELVLRLVELAAAWARDRQADAAPDIVHQRAPARSAS
jgi:DNA-binding transcriptional LysR family regulator